jgi:hypothetical protein
MDCKILELVADMLAEYGPITDQRLIPPRVLLYHGKITNDRLLAIHLNEDELVLEDLSGNVNAPLACFNINNPYCMEKLQQAVQMATRVTHSCAGGCTHGVGERIDCPI